MNPVARLFIVLSIALLLVPGSLSADGNHQIVAIRLVVPFAAGAETNDIIARFVARHLSSRLGWSITVDNCSGVSGITGTEIVATAMPDGYTFLMGSVSVAVNPSLYRNLPFDTERKPVPVTLLAFVPPMVVVNALPEVRDRLTAMGAERVGRTPEQFAAFVRSETHKWTRIVRDAGIQRD